MFSYVVHFKFFFLVLPVWVTTEDQLSIPSILFGHTTSLHVLLHYIDESSLPLFFCLVAPYSISFVLFTLSSPPKQSLNSPVLSTPQQDSLNSPLMPFLPFNLVSYTQQYNYFHHISIIPVSLSAIVPTFKAFVLSKQL